MGAGQHSDFKVLSFEENDEPFKSFAHLEKYRHAILPEMEIYKNIQISMAGQPSGALLVLLGMSEIKEAYGRYDFHNYLPNYLPVGTDGGGKVLTLSADGLFAFEWGDLDPLERVSISNSLKSFLKTADNADIFFGHYTG